MVEPTTSISIKMNTENRQSTSRNTGGIFRVEPCLKDSGLAIYDPHGYWYGMPLSSVNALVKWLTEWTAFRQWQFKPLGFTLVSISGETREIKDGARCEIVGDSFVLRTQSGEQIGEAMSAAVWTLTPILPSSV